MKKYLYDLMTDKENGFLARILKVLLWVLSVLYGFFVQIRVLLYQLKIKKQNKLPKPVISVGNITWGGVGKTPLVEYIAKILKEKGLKPVILTRGYMAEKSKEPSIKSDEAQMLKDSLADVPVLVGKNRFKNATEFLKNNNADIFILDDGFQHISLYRDIDIVAIDSTNPFGNQFLIPRGILREPLVAFNRADMFVLTKTNLSAEKRVSEIKNFLKEWADKKPIVLSEHKMAEFVDLKSGHTKDLAFIAQKNICCFSGIADPKSFEQSLMHLKANIQKSVVFQDHYVYAKEDLSEISKYCLRRNVDNVVTTLKDAVKLKNMLDVFDPRIFVLALRMEITIKEGKDVFLDRIFSLIPR